MDITVDQVGEYLEHQGLSDDEIDEFLEHFDVPGMKWGVRKQRILERTQRVADGTGSRGDKFKTAMQISGASLKRNHGLKGAAAEQARFLEGLKQRTETGQLKVSDVLNVVGTTRIFSQGNSKTDAGRSNTEPYHPKYKKTVKTGQSSSNKILKVVGKTAAAGVVGYGIGYVAGKGLEKMILG